MELDALIVDVVERRPWQEMGNIELMRPLRLYDRHNPLELLHTDQQFIEFYRFPRQKIIDISEMVSQEITHPTRRSRSLSAALQVCIALKFYAFGSYLKDLCELFNVDKASVSRCITSVTNALCRRAADFIFLPGTVEQSSNVKRKFASIDPNIPNVIGAIDGTHIRITNLRVDEEALYINRKNYHSINVQVISDAELIFRNVVARFPGKTHDAYILRRSNIFEIFEEGQIRGYVLGDSAYPARGWLLTPLAQERGEADRKYNICQRKLRNVVERAIGVCKARFRCLDNSSALRFRPKKCCRIILAVCVLHNLARQANLPFEEPQLMLDEADEEVHEGDHNEYAIGREARNRIIDRYFL